MKRTILSLVFLSALFPAFSQELTTLRQCLEIGLERNYDILLVKNEEIISANNATRANAGQLPSLDLTGAFGGSRTGSSLEYESGDQDKYTGIYEQNAAANITLDWMVFDGLKIRTTYKKLGELKKIGEIRTRIAIEDFIATFTAEYYNYIQQIIRLKNFRYAVKLSAERLRIVEERFKIGSFSRLDLLQARVDFNEDSSKYMSQQRLVKSSMIHLNELLAFDQFTVPIKVRDSVIDVNSSLEYDNLKTELLETNASLLEADRNTVISELDLKAIKARNYPYIALSASYGYNYNLYGNSSTRLRYVLGPSAQVKLGYTLFDGNRRREQRNAKIEVENANLQRAQLEQSLLSDLANFWQAYRNDLEVIALEEQNLIAAKQNYEIAMERYKLGDLPGIEMREAQKSLLDAEERILSAEYETKLCEISLMQVSGNALNYLQQ